MKQNERKDKVKEKRVRKEYQDVLPTCKKGKEEKRQENGLKENFLLLINVKSLRNLQEKRRLSTKEPISDITDNIIVINLHCVLRA